MDISIDQIIERAGTPVSLPEVYQEINELVDNPRRITVAGLNEGASTIVIDSPTAIPSDTPDPYP